MLTLEQVLSLAGIDTSKDDERGALLGLALYYFSGHPLAASRSLGWHLRRISRAIELDQIKFFFDRFGRNCGFVWWTAVPPKHQREVLKWGPDVIDENLLSRDGDAWMVDFHANFGELFNVLFGLNQLLPSECDSLTYFRVKQGLRIAKRISRQSSTSFFERRPPESKIHEAAWLGSADGRSTRLLVKSGLERTIHCGLILELLGRLSFYSEMSLSVAFDRIKPALARKQYSLLRAPEGTVLGFYSWLWRESHGVISAKPLHLLEQPDWNDGRDALLGDAVAVHEGVNVMQEELSSFAHGRWSFYPECSGPTRVAALSQTSPLAMTDAHVYDFSASYWSGEGVPICRI